MDKSGPEPESAPAPATPAPGSTGSAVHFLSSEWIELLGELVPTAGGGALRLGQIVEGAPGGDVAYTIILGEGANGTRRIVPDSVAGADVVLVESYDTARGLAKGTLTTADALRASLIKVRGAAKLLAVNEELLIALGDALAELRSRTAF